MQRYRNSRDIPHEEFRQLRLDGKWVLGIQDEIAHQISTRKICGVKGSSTSSIRIPDKLAPHFLCIPSIQLFHYVVVFINNP